MKPRKPKVDPAVEVAITELFKAVGMLHNTMCKSRKFPERNCAANAEQIKVAAEAIRKLSD